MTSHCWRFATVLWFCDSEFSCSSATLSLFVCFFPTWLVLPRFCAATSQFLVKPLVWLVCNWWNRLTTDQNLRSTFHKNSDTFMNNFYKHILLDAHSTNATQSVSRQLCLTVYWGPPTMHYVIKLAHTDVGPAAVLKEEDEALYHSYCVVNTKIGWLKSECLSYLKSMMTAC